MFLDSDDNTETGLVNEVVGKGAPAFFCSIIIVILGFFVLIGCSSQSESTETEVTELLSQPTATFSATFTVTPSATPSATPSNTPTPEPTATPSPTPVPTVSEGELRDSISGLLSELDFVETVNIVRFLEGSIFVQVEANEPAVPADFDSPLDAVALQSYIIVETLAPLLQESYLNLVQLAGEDGPTLRLIVTTPYQPSLFEPPIGEYVHHTETPFGSLERVTDEVSDDERYRYQFVWFTIDTVRWENPNPYSIWTSFER